MTFRIVNTDNLGGDYPDEKFVEYASHNEACAFCGVPRDIHRGPDAPPETSPHTTWGWLSCRDFHRCDSPRAAYGDLLPPTPMEFDTEDRAQVQADILNGPYPERSSRYYKVVEMPYELAPGFEP